VKICNKSAAGAAKRQPVQDHSTLPWPRPLSLRDSLFRLFWTAQLDVLNIQSGEQTNQYLITVSHQSKQTH